MKANYLTAVALVALMSTTASASILGGVLTNGLNAINDVNRERVLKGALSVDDPLTPFDETNDGTPFLLQVGDILEAVLIMDNINNGSGSFLVDSVPGLAGLTVYSRIVVTSKLDLGGGEFRFTFGSGFGDGFTTAEIYESSSLDDIGMFDSAVDITASNIADATDGTLLFTLGLAAASPDFWRATGTDNLLLVSTGDPVNFNFGLTVGLNPAGVPIVTDGVSTLAGFHDVRGSGQVFNISDPTLAGGWQAASNTQVEFLVRGIVPEAGTLTMWAVLACVSGFAAKRRFVKA